MYSKLSHFDRKIKGSETGNISPWTTEYIHHTYKRLQQEWLCCCSIHDGAGGLKLKYSECFNCRFSGLILPCLAVVGCWWCTGTSQWQLWYLYIFPHVFRKTFFGLHENHPGHSLAQPENFFWVGHGFQRLNIIFLQGRNLQMRFWPHDSILKAEAPVGRLWSGLQTVAHSAALPSSPASLAAALIDVPLLWNTKSQQSLQNWRRSGFHSSFSSALVLSWMSL